MVSIGPSASTAALGYLDRIIRSANGVLDLEWMNSHFARLGAKEVDKQLFEARIQEVVFREIAWDDLKPEIARPFGPNVSPKDDLSQLG